MRSLASDGRFSLAMTPEMRSRATRATAKAARILWRARRRASSSTCAVSETMEQEVAKLQVQLHKANATIDEQKAVIERLNGGTWCWCSRIGPNGRRMSRSELFACCRGSFWAAVADFAKVAEANRRGDHEFRKLQGMLPVAGCGCALTVRPECVLAPCARSHHHEEQGDAASVSCHGREGDIRAAGAAASGCVVSGAVVELNRCWCGRQARMLQDLLRQNAEELEKYKRLVATTTSEGEPEAAGAQSGVDGVHPLKRLSDASSARVRAPIIMMCIQVNCPVYERR